MDHSQALQSQACEKYLLGELAPAERDAYEAHYFSCPECAMQLRAAADFLAASREIFAAAPDLRPSPDPIRNGFGWMTWFKPAYAIPAFAILLLVIGYQNFVTIPDYRRAVDPQVLPMHSLITANTLGVESLNFVVSPGQPFGLYVDAPYDPVYSTYRLTLVAPSGSTTSLRSLSAAEAQKTQIITINPGRQAGRYTIVVSGLAAPNADLSSAKELARLQFTVAFPN